ncbi:alpha-2-macroglobulin-like [Scleropages formosus]|uniref:alpha-2-macroglobulin-like n=1 Tax=Scleropages formosus TaxID=113540 RepID=UPI0010FA9321|nr:alpha-2-macroglobulin-like [Scleropages formosus]
MFGFFIVFLLLQTTHSHTVGKSIYLVIVISQTVSGNAETLCAHLLPKEPVTFTVTLVGEPVGNRTLLRETVTRDFHRCVAFQVPAVSAATTAAIHASVQGASETLQKITEFIINPSSNVVVIQTDKPIYKPGQMAMFRIAAMSTSFLSLNQIFQTVELQDPNRNRIAQWLNQSSVSGILDFSYPIATEAMQGVYVITAWDERGRKTSHKFQVKEYVLPKCEVKIHLPNFISVQDKRTTIKVCGKYTYGKPVFGSVKALVCLKASLHRQIGSTPGCFTFRMSMEKTGCATETIDLIPMKLQENYNLRVLSVDCEIEESETGVTLKGSGSTFILKNIITISFQDTQPHFKSGIPYYIKVKVAGSNSAALENKPVSLLVKHGYSSDKWTLTTDSKGIAQLLVDTSSWMDEIVRLEAHYKEDTDSHRTLGFQIPAQIKSAYFSVQKFYSNGLNFVKIMQIDGEVPCDSEGLLKSQYIIQRSELQNDQELLTFFYLVLSRGSAVQHGHIEIAVKDGVNKGEFTVHVRQTRDLAPYAQVVVYTVLPSGEIVADSSTVPIQKCLKNKVSLKFSSLQELPGKKTTLDLTADPGSLCSLRAVDQSVLLMEPQVELTVDSVYGKLELLKMSGYPSSVTDRVPQRCYHTSELWNIEFWDRYSRRINAQRHRKIYDTYWIFKGLQRAGASRSSQEIGVKILTNSDVREPKMCFSQYSKENLTEIIELLHFFSPNGFYVRKKTAEVMKFNQPSQPEIPKESIRTYFPETWIWDLVPMGDSGSVKVEHTVPDTITKWVAGAFCSSPTGFGLAPNTDLTAFQPFFVSLTLPYSVIRGEAFTLKATVFNYLSKCIMVQVNLNESAQYAAQPCEGCKYTHCLCGEESKTFKWILKPADLGEVSVNVRAEALRTEELCGSEVVTVPERGRIDTVVRTLLVEAEGTKETIIHNSYSCSIGSLVEKNVPLKLPEVFVQGSHKAFLSVMGDLMGRAMKNLGSLLAMPYGCGEQNMVLFAPNIYILRYLETTRQLTEEIKAKATRFLENGYQRELNYKHHDGSYSAFGKADGSGNTWLTAFVLKSFGGAKPYIFVDPRHITDAINWLSRHQQPSGCFMAVGKLFNNKMKGGVSDEVSLTAYITAGLLELNRNSTTSMVARSLSCLKNASGQLENLYTTALLSYTFTLAGDQEMRSKLIAHLASKAKISGGSWQWQHLDTSSKKTDSLEVEMASYMLLALLSGPQLPGFGLGYASVLVRWLVQQQNPYGGFSSTQDTVVALQALSLYSSATFSPEGDTTVTVTSGGGYKQEFKLNQHNRFLYQEEELEVPGDYSIKAEGKGCALVQITVHYNIPPPADFSAFSITATAEGPCNRARKTLNVTIEVWYNGRREETNMVIVSIKLLSGYLPDKASLQTLRQQPTVKRIEENEGHVIIYVDEVMTLSMKP